MSPILLNCDHDVIIRGVVMNPAASIRLETTTSFTCKKLATVEDVPQGHHFLDLGFNLILSFTAIAQSMKPTRLVVGWLIRPRSSHRRIGQDV